MGVSDNLANLMEQQGLNTHTLAKKSDVPQPRIHEIVSGKTKNPQMKTLRKLSLALGVTVDQLTGSDSSGRDSASHDSGKVPVFHMAGLGSPRLSTGEIVKLISLPEGFYKLGMVVVLAEGSSMEPVIFDGAIVGVDVRDKEYVSGKYYAVWMDDEGAIIKKLSSEPGKVFVESLNKNERSFYVDKEALRDHFILGRVRWWINQDFEGEDKV